MQQKNNHKILWMLTQLIYFHSYLFFRFIKNNFIYIVLCSYDLNWKKSNLN